MEFKSIKAARDHVQSVLAGVGPTFDLRLRAPDAFRFVWTIMEQHPRATAKLANVERVEIRRLRRDMPMLGVYLHKSDGEIDDISVLNNCITRREATHRATLLNAMRQAVTPQIRAYRSTQQFPACNVCGTIIGDMHVDHAIEFVVLADRFLDGRDDVPRTFLPDPTAICHSRFRDSDADFERAWQEYHESNAIFQMACRACNTSELRVRRNAERVAGSGP